MSGWRLREHVASILVATLSTAFGVSLLQVTGALGEQIASGTAGTHDTAIVLLTIVAFVFIGLAVYVGALVTANTFATIVAGRTRIIALRRLVGSTPQQERAAITTEGLAVGVIGALVGSGVGTALSVLVVAIAQQQRWMLDGAVSYLPPLVWLPIVAVVATTALAAYTGSRGVLRVTPVQAIGMTSDADAVDSGSRRGRAIAAIVVGALGAVLLVLGIVVGLVTPLGILVAFVGGVVSFSGIVAGAPFVMPRVLAVVGRMLGRSVPARIAAATAARHRDRSARLAISLTIGVTLITTLLVASSSFRSMVLLFQQESPGSYAGIDLVLNAVVSVFALLIGVSAVLAAIGLVNTLSLSVLQRTRELGLLRALGLSGGQLRAMITAESVQLAAGAVLAGLALGILYGWAGAQSLLGSSTGSPGLVAPTVPVALVVLLVAAAVVLALGAAVTPARRAARLSPVAALAAD